MRIPLSFLTFSCCVLIAFAQLAPGDKRLSQARMTALSGCVHDGRYYYERSLIPTVDSCINCKCENGMVRCNMTLCPLYPNIQDGCQLTHEAGSCCPQLTCDENAAKRLAPVSAIHEATLLGCTYNDFEFGLGDFIPTSDPCQACYCIHNKTQCVHQNCALPESAREGCRPVYRHGICCPIRYDCTEALAAPATSRPPFLTEGCAVNNRLYDEGEAIHSGKSCEHCYCMKGEMICAMQKCDSPMAGCTPIVKEGQCCPERYECPNNTDSVFMPLNEVSKSVGVNTIQANYPAGKYSSTTRGLEDEIDLGNFQQTTSPSVTATTPLFGQTTTLGSLTAWQVGLPTVTPTQAKVGFTGVSGVDFAKDKLEVPIVITIDNQTISASGTAVSAAWTSSSNQTVDNVKHFKINSVDEILPYDVIQTKIGSQALSASEVLNSGEPLGSRLTLTNISVPSNVSTSMATSSGRTTLTISHDQSEISAQASSLGSHQSSSSANGLNMTSLQNSVPDNRLMTHVVGGSSSLNMVSGKNSDVEIQLNTKLNMSNISSEKAGNVNSIQNNKNDGWQNLPSPSGNWTRRTVQLAPLDPTKADHIEGFLDFTTPSSTLFPLNLSAVDPDPSSDIEGLISRPHTDKLVVQVPYAHLTEVGLAGQPSDPLVTDDVEGKLYSESPIIFENTEDVPAKNTSLKVPISASQLEGNVSNIIIAVNSTRIRLSPLDPEPHSDVEGVLEPAKSSVEKAASNSMPVDPASASEIEGILSALTLASAQATTLAFISGDLSTSTSPTTTTEKPMLLIPADPTNSSSIEGLTPAVNRTKDTIKKALISPPVDPISTAEVEGALVSKHGDGNPNGIIWNITAVNKTAAEGGEGETWIHEAIESTNLTAKNLTSTSEPDLRLSGTIGGALVETTTKENSISAPPVLHPLDPNIADLLEGLLKGSEGSQRVQFPAEPLLGDTVEGLWKAISTNQSHVDKLASADLTPNITSQNLSQARGPSQLAAAETTEKTLVISDIVPSSTAASGTTLLTVNVNGSFPANLVLALSSVTRNKTWGSSTTLASTTAPTAPAKAVSLSAVTPTNFKVGLPWDPSISDDIEGQLHATVQAVNHQGALVSPVDAIPTDQYEGLERPVENLEKPVTTPASSKLVLDLSIVNGSKLEISVSEDKRNLSWFSVITEAPVLISSTQPSVEMTSAQSSTSVFVNLTSAASTQSSEVTSTVQTTLPWTSTEEPLEGIKDVESVLKSYNGQNFVKFHLRSSLKNASDEEENFSLSVTPKPASWSYSDGVNDSSVAVPSAFPPGPPLTGIYENGCYFDGNYYRNYQSIPTNDLVDPCLVRLCKDGMIFGPSQQRCPPPIEGCFSTSIPGVCCPVYLCPNYLERNETSYTLTAATGDTLNTEKTRLALAKFCRVGPRFLALNERVVHVMGIQCQTCTCKSKGIVCEPGCAQGILITTEIPPVTQKRLFATFPTSPPSTTAMTVPPLTEPVGTRSCVIRKKRFLHGEEVTFNDPCHVCTCMDGLVICKVNKSSCRSAKILELDSFF